MPHSPQTTNLIFAQQRFFPTFQDKEIIAPSDSLQDIFDRFTPLSVEFWHHSGFIFPLTSKKHNQDDKHD